MSAVLKTSFQGAVNSWQGKVRDIYDLGDKLMIVATDRISAFDHILPTGIVDKGIILTKLSVFWFNLMGSVVENHIISTNVDEFDVDFGDDIDTYRGRTMLVRKAEVVPIECVVRGYMAGSAWREYKESGTVCGIQLPTGLSQAEKLPEPLFTPATKAASGHDENVSFEETERIVGAEVAGQLRDKSLAIFAKAGEYAGHRGLILSDTKFEFGHADGELILIDELLTPDSSRFWLTEKYEPGRAQDGYCWAVFTTRLQSDT